MDGIVAEVLVSVAKTFAVMAIGAAYRRWWRRDVSLLNDLAMQLFVPCLAFSAILSQEASARELGAVVGAALIVLAGMLPLAAAAFRLARVGTRELWLPVVFMNTANLPFPILEANYGRVGLGFGVLFYMTVQTVLFSLGILALSRSSDVRTLLRTPVFLATALAVGLNLGGVEPPALLIDTTALVGAAAIPIILFTFGYALAGVRIESWGRTLIASVLRLGGGFLLGLVAVEVLALEGILRDVVVLDAAMPSAVITVTLAARYRRDAEQVASVVFATTLAAAFLLPVLLIWLRS